MSACSRALPPLPVLPPGLVLGGTGHRPHRIIGPDGANGYHAATKALLYRFAVDVVRHYQPRRGKVGMAQGWDMALGWACVELGVPFDALVPFPGQESRWPKPAQEEYRSLLSYAEEVVVVYRGRISDAAIRRALLLRNERINDDSEGLLALYDGGEDGGTALCVRDGEAKHGRIANVWDRWVARVEREQLRRAA
jgi:hypothetical protein